MRHGQQSSQAGPDSLDMVRGVAAHRVIGAQFAPSLTLRSGGRKPKMIADVQAYPAMMQIQWSRKKVQGAFAEAQLELEEGQPALVEFQATSV